MEGELTGRIIQVNDSADSLDVIVAYMQRERFATQLTAMVTSVKHGHRCCAADINRTRRAEPKASIKRYEHEHSTVRIA